MSERAIVKPVKGGEFKYKQSRFKHLPSVPFRCLCSGRSAAGKGVLVTNVVTDFFRDAFKKVYVFAPTVHLDNTWQTIAHHCNRNLKQSEYKEQFLFEDFDTAALADIMKKQRRDISIQKADDDIKELKGCLVIIDDFSDSSQLRLRSDGIINKLMCTGRHYGISLWINVHSINSLGSLARRQASTLIIFKVTNTREYQSLREQFGELIGLESFDAAYELAAGKDSPAYSFMTIFPNSHDPKRTLMARFDQCLEPET